MVGARGIPHTYLIDPKGKLIWDGHPSELTKKRLQAALKGARKPAKKSIFAWTGEVEGAPEEALELAATGELAKALARLDGDESPGAAQLREELNAHIADLIRQVKAGMERGDTTRALGVLRELSDELARRPEGQAIAKQLSNFEKDAAIQNELAAEKALDKALEVARKRGIKKATKSLQRVVDKFPGTHAAKRAAKLIENA